MKKAIRLDDQRTWPVEVRQWLNENFESLRRYEIERARIDKLAEEDLSLRINPPDNPDKPTYKETISKLTSVLSSYELVGYHCARLHREDVASILKDGLCPLSPELQRDRICRRRDAGDITVEIANRLLAENLSVEQNRSGIIWFMFTREMLQDEGGLERLFASWGGESIYCGQESDTVVGPILRGIGEPCIVEAAVPIGEIETFCEIGRRFYVRYMHSRRVRTESRADMEGYVRSTRPVLRIIRSSDSEFEQLTRYSTWGLRT